MGIDTVSKTNTRLPRIHMVDRVHWLTRMRLSGVSREVNYSSKPHEGNTTRDQLDMERKAHTYKRIVEHTGNQAYGNEEQSRKFTVAMPHSVKNLQLVVSIPSTQSIEGDSHMSTSIATRLGRGSSYAQIDQINHRAYTWSWRRFMGKVAVFWNKSQTQLCTATAQGSNQANG